MHTKHLGTIQYEAADNLSAPHAFTTRLGGVSLGSLGAMNLSMHRGDPTGNVQKNFELLATALDFDLRKLVFTHQTHSDIVRTVGCQDPQGLDHHSYPPCDGLITNASGLALCIFTADCTPILLQDPVTGAVGAVHAGWRGTARDIAGKAVRTMTEQFGCDPANIRAAIGPNIGPCCFETDGDVPAAMLETYGSAAQTHILAKGHKYYVNLKALNALSLHRAGVQAIDISSHCTVCQSTRYFSHRVQGANRGSQGAIIVRR